MAHHALRSLSLVLALATPSLALAEPPTAKSQPAQAKAEKPFVFDTYQLVILRRGPKAKQFTEAQLEALQAQHLGHLKKMGDQGKMVAAGPFSDQPDESFRGLCLYRVGSLEEAKALAEADPMVKSGRLEVLVMTWNVPKGQLAFPNAPTAPETKKTPRNR